MGKEYRKNLLEKAGETFRQLTWREQRILSMRYGLDEPEKTVKQVAAHFEVSDSTIRKYEGVLHGRDLKDAKGNVYDTVFLVEENDVF